LKRNPGVKPKKGILKEKVLLVEFKAPKKLIEAFDTKLKPQFSSRSEAIRSLMRTFLNETSERS
jgi:metal-responsive CopG/Arc/MetJ family transcriptional regulator